MNRFSAIATVLLLLAAIPVEAGIGPVKADEGITQTWTNGHRGSASPLSSCPDGITAHPALRIIVARGIDLRDVDWSKDKVDKNGGNGKKDNGAKGEEEDEKGGDEEKDGKDEEKEEPEAGGWDRLWDAPKLG